MSYARKIALTVLAQIERGQKSSSALNAAHKKYPTLSQVDRSLVTELVYGVLRWRGAIDWVIAQYSDKVIAKLSPLVLDVLRLGIYQLKWLEKVAIYAAIHETVELIKKTPERKATPFINAILREVDRKRDEIQTYLEKDSTEIKDISVRYSHPAWLIDRWVKEFGLEEALNICRANNSIAPLCLRINQVRGPREEWLGLITKERSDIKWVLANFAPHGVYIFGGGSVQNLPGYDDGWFQVQDEASQLVALALDPKPGDVILDVCAAPGGKTTHMAEMAQDKAHILALDRDFDRLKLLKQNCARLKLKSVEIKYSDFLKEKDLLTFDRILVDAPCSALGTFRRRPEAKWNRTVSQMKELGKIQIALLGKAALHLSQAICRKRFALANRAQGGVLVYSVCTFTPEETENVVSFFLKNHPEFVIDPLDAILPDACKRLISKEGWIKVLPTINGPDGYFMVRFRKNVA